MKISGKTISVGTYLGTFGRRAVFGFPTEESLDSFKLDSFKGVDTNQSHHIIKM